MSPLPKEREVNQSIITSFFNKSPKKKSAKTDPYELATKKEKGKEKMADTRSKQDARKVLPRKSTRSTQLSINPKLPATKERKLPVMPQPKLSQQRRNKKNRKMLQLQSLLKQE